MSTLLLRLAAPLQSWGSDSKFERRTTERQPTKSGVIGLLAAALGRRRNESLDDLARLKFGVRIERPGQVMVDFHTAKSKARRDPYVTRRYYLEDAMFLVGLEGDEGFLSNLEYAIKNPFFPLYLGRRSCPPTGEICIGLVDKSLEEALLEGCDNSTPIALDSENVGAYRQRDIPISFDPAYRRFAYRYIKSKTNHDAYEGVGE